MTQISISLIDQMVMAVFQRNGHYAAHVGLPFRPILGCFGEKVFNSRGSGIDEHANTLIGIILKP
jgi:hypothetical protein